MKRILKLIGYSEDLELKNKFTYVINGFSIGLVLMFSIFYIIIVQSVLVNSLTGLCLLFLFTAQYLLKRKLYFAAKIMMITGFNFQVFSLVFLWFPVEANFNYFYFIVAPISFLIFDFKDRKDRWTIVLINGMAVVLLLISEMMVIDSFLIPIGQTAVRLFSGLSIVSTIGSMAIVFYFYAHSLQITHRDLELLARTDSLTKVNNRRSLFEQGEQYFRASRKYSQPFCFLIFDLDHFKKVNDEYGHPAGDAVLLRIAELVSSVIRHEDLFSRYGGEEFALLLKNTDLESGLKTAEKIRKIIEATTIISPDGKEIHVTVSLGLVSSDPSFESLEKMILCADKALYTAKEQGRNRVISSRNC